MIYVMKDLRDYDPQSFPEAKSSAQAAFFHAVLAEQWVKATEDDEYAHCRNERSTRRSDSSFS